MTNAVRATFLFALLSVVPAVGLHAVEAELGGSLASMRRQHQVARQHDYTFLRTPAQVREFVREDRLQPLITNEYLVVSRVSFPYARPAVTMFVERLARQYHEATGERLVVTSLTRPLSRQPRNAHKLSVHPTGMAVDFRIPRNPASRAWLEGTLLALERRGVLDATRERRPPHYHVAVFPEKYSAYVQRLLERDDRGSHAPRLAEAPVNVDASLEPSQGSDTEHEHDFAQEPVVADDPIPGGAVPLAASLGIAGVAVMGLIRSRIRRGREERRARSR